MATGNRVRGELHPKAKLTEDEVRMIRELFNMGFSTKIISKNYKVSEWNVKSIVKNLTWTHLIDEKDSD